MFFSSVYIAKLGELKLVTDSQGQDVGVRRTADKGQSDQIPFKPERSPSQEILQSLVI